jgi:hypothetical protein
MDGNSTIPTDAEHDAHFCKPCCEQCGKHLDHCDNHDRDETEDILCDSCKVFIYADNLEKGWHVYLASLPDYAAKTAEEIDNRLAGWNMVEAKLEFERDSIGKVRIAKAHDFRYVHKRGEAALVFGREGIQLQANHRTPEWSVLFPFTTPSAIILAACVAAGNQP